MDISSVVKRVCQSLLKATLLVGGIGSAYASQSLDLQLDFDAAVSGTEANSYLREQGITGLSFGNADRVDDVPIYDSEGHLLNDNAFHWVDASVTYGAVQIKQDTQYAVSKSNLLWNDGAPILIQFEQPVDLASFSIQQDLSSFGNPQYQGSVLSFLDQTGHVIESANVYFTQGDQPGLKLSAGSVANVSAILLPAIKGYDNLVIQVAAAVPEPATWSLLALGAGVLLLSSLSVQSRRNKR